MESELFKECQEDLQDPDYMVGIQEKNYNIKVS